MPVRRLVFVSDLHLDVRPVEAGRDAAAAFTEFLSAELLPDPGTGAGLVLLGDSFELLDAGDEAAAVARIDQIAAAHPELFARLGDCLRRGWRLEVIPGNHDMALALPRVQRRLDTLLGPTDRMRVWPWLFRTPGLVYAEHGHQHHDLNRFPTVLAPYDRRRPERLFEPPLAAWRGGPRRLLRAVADSRRAERTTAHAPYRARLSEQAAQVGLPLDVVIRLHRLSRFRPQATLARLARRRLRRVPPDSYLIAAARHIHEVLSAAGHPVPAYVFGHTHRARAEPLVDGAWYLNTGTWSADVRGDGPDRDDPDLFPYVELRAGAVPTVRYWRRPAVD
jgi:hypothetical protein